MCGVTCILFLILATILLVTDAATPWVLPSGCTEYKSDMGGTQAAKGACGTHDTTKRWSGVARLCSSFDGADGNPPPAGLCSGCTTTFIEDDVIASEAHCLSFDPDTPPCCDAPGDSKATVCDFTTSSPAPDFQDGRTWYVVAGADTRTSGAQIIIGKVLSFAARSTGPPPGYDIYVAHVDRKCELCHKDYDVTPIPLASNYPAIGAAATHVFTAGTGGDDGRPYAYRQSLPNVLNKPVGSSDSTEPCRRQGVLMKPEVGNPLQIFDTSGSPVFVQECDKDVLHGFHGNGENGAWCTESETEVNGKRYMCEVLQLVQSQKEWIQKKVTEWTGRKTLRDSCSTTGYREDSDPYKVAQYGCRSDASRVASAGSDDFFATFHKCSGAMRHGATVAIVTGSVVVASVVLMFV